MKANLVEASAWERWGWMAESVARRHGVSVEGLLGPRKTHLVVTARHDLMSCLWGSGLPYAEIGRLLGRDHSSVMHGVRRSL